MSMNKTATQRICPLPTDTVEIPFRSDISQMLIDLLPSIFADINGITETDKYFCKGQARFKKTSFLNDLMLKPEIENNTSGKLFLTTEHEWIAKASDRRYTSWTSCFSPGGCFWSSCIKYCSSPNVYMAMIMNSTMTKMIGRKWVLIPTNIDTGEPLPMVMFLKEYGTFPGHYQRLLESWVEDNLFPAVPAWERIRGSRDDRIYRLPSFIAAQNPRHVFRCDNVNSYHVGTETWFDEVRHLCILDGLANNRVELNKGYILWDDDALRRLNRKYNVSGRSCAYCGDNIEDDDDDDEYNVDINGDPICNYCANENYVWSEYHDCYVLAENSARALIDNRYHDYVSLEHVDYYRFIGHDETMTDDEIVNSIIELSMDVNENIRGDNFLVLTNNGDEPITFIEHHALSGRHAVMGRNERIDVQRTLALNESITNTLIHEHLMNKETRETSTIACAIYNTNDGYVAQDYVDYRSMFLDVSEREDKLHSLFHILRVDVNNMVVLLSDMCEGRIAHKLRSSPNLRVSVNSRLEALNNPPIVIHTTTGTATVQSSTSSGRWA